MTGSGNRRDRYRRPFLAAGAHERVTWSACQGEGRCLGVGILERLGVKQQFVNLMAKVLLRANLATEIMSAFKNR